MENRQLRGGRGLSTSIVPFAILALVSGCSSGSPFEGSISASPSAAMELSWVKAKRTNEGIEVWGQVQQVHCCRYVRGYIVLEAKSANGVNLASTQARWGEFNPRQLHSAWFRAVLPVAPETNISAVDIQFKTER